MKGKKLIYSGLNDEVWYSPKTGKYYHYRNGKLIGTTTTGNPADLK